MKHLRRVYWAQSIWVNVRTTTTTTTNSSKTFEHKKQRVTPPPHRQVAWRPEKIGPPAALLCESMTTSLIWSNYDRTLSAPLLSNPLWRIQRRDQTTDGGVLRKIDVHPNFSEAPHLRRSISHAKTEFSRNKIASPWTIPWPQHTKTSFFETRLAFFFDDFGLKNPVIQKRLNKAERWDQVPFSQNASLPASQISNY